MRRINISQVDSLFANGSYPIEFLFYYKERLQTQSIRLALKKLSNVFWPLFGEYKAGIIHFDRYSEEECFGEVRHEQEFDMAETHENLYKNYCRLNPSEMKKLFYLMIIQYKNGTVLIPKMNHLAGDGYSYFYFLSALAAISRGPSVPFKKNLIRFLFKPNHNRTVLKDFLFNIGELNPLPDKEKFSIQLEEIPRKEVRDIMKSIASKFNQQVSPNDILSAMAIKKSVMLQKGYFGKYFRLTIPIDVRRQIKEYGKRYFGNGIMLKVINFKTEDIENSSAEVISTEIRKSMPSVSKEDYIEYLEGLENMIAQRQTDELRPYDPKSGCLVTNISRLPVDKLDFGTGSPDLIFPLTIEKNSTGILADKDNYILRLA